MDASIILVTRRESGVARRGVEIAEVIYVTAAAIGVEAVAERDADADAGIGAGPEVATVEVASTGVEASGRETGVIAVVAGPIAAVGGDVGAAVAEAAAKRRPSLAAVATASISESERRGEEEDGTQN